MLDEWVREFGDPLAWITTAAVLIAAGQYLGDRRKRRDESEREARSQATRLMAWAVTDAQKKVWGIRILNDSGSTFHDVVIDARMLNLHPKLPITMRIVPPGDYLVQPKRWSPEIMWDFPGTTAECPVSLRPLASTEKFGVDRIRFSDNRGQTWITDDRATLRRAPAEPDAFPRSPPSPLPVSAGRRRRG